MSSNSNKPKASGTRAEVWHGTAVHTSGGLYKKDLFHDGERIRSRAASNAAKKSKNLGNLLAKPGDKFDPKAKAAQARLGKRRTGRAGVRRRGPRIKRG